MKNDGFTFIESIVSISILLVVFSAIALFLTTHGKLKLPMNYTESQIQVLHFNKQVREELNNLEILPGTKEETIQSMFSKVIEETAKPFKKITINETTMKPVEVPIPNTDHKAKKTVIRIKFSIGKRDFEIIESIFI